LKTVTYGTASAPFLAIRSLQELANDTANDGIRRVILEDFYVDDLITGGDSLDTLQVIRDFQVPEINGIITKRTILSTTAKMFDPIGLISPIIITAKILMQRLWELHISWDDEVPQEIKSEWENFCLRLELCAALLLARQDYITKLYDHLRILRQIQRICGQTQRSHYAG
ncbi:Pao retrotransposon peptidase, partial [Popillia japonica]